MTSELVTAEPERDRLAVLGSPIAHSLSPKLHTAAYRTLGLPWDYQAIEISGGGLPAFFETCGDNWRGLSLTMPLKREVMSLLDSVDRVAGITGVANTVLFAGTRRIGFNTDVAGITRALVQEGVSQLRHVVILGGGATAASALVAAHELGAVSAHLWVRTPTKATAIGNLAHGLGMHVTLSAFTDANDDVGHPDAVFSTLPNGSVVDLMFAEEVRREAVLFDVAYDPWPTPLAASWLDAAGRVIPGLQMLVNQALVQARIFVSGNPDGELPGEPAVLQAMVASIAQPNTQA